MATITITPGNSFTPNQTVTSTRLNDLGSPTAALTAASIGTADIADDAITSALIADDAITTASIADDAVTTASIADDAVTTALIADDAITTALIADDAVTSALIADDAVTTPAILDANVTFAKLTDVIDSDTMTGASATTLATSESIKAYVDGEITSNGITQTTGTAPYYGCRAFASYNGSTQVLNNGANIASVTRNSVGKYTFNFDVDMPDVNYSLVVGGTFFGQVNNAFISAFQTTSKTTSSFQIQAAGGGPSSSTFIDQPTVDVAVFR